MTEQDAQRYAEAVKRYEEEKRRIHILPYGDKDFNGFFSLKTLKTILFAVVVFGLVVLLLGGVFGLIMNNMTQGFKAIATFIGVPLLASLPYYYLCYLNNINDKKVCEAVIANIIIWVIVSYLFNVKSIAALICVYIVALFVIIKIMKSIYYTIDEPRARDYDSLQQNIDAGSLKV